MTTTVEAVRRHLERDPALADTVVRGVANLRRTARWMIEEHGWDATEEAVVSGLRKYMQTHSTPPLWAERDRLQRAEVGLRTGLALLSMDRSFDVHERMQDVWSTVGPFDRTAILPGRRHLHLIVDDFDLDTVQQTLPAGSVEEVLAPLALVEVVLPDTPEGEADVGVLTPIVGMLVHKGIDVREVVTSTPESLILVPGDQAVDAYELTCQLVGENAGTDEGSR